MAATSIAFAAAAVVYSLSTVAFFAHLWRGGKRWSLIAMVCLGLGTVPHAAFAIGHLLRSPGPVLGSIYDTLAVGSLLVAVAYLATMRKHRLTVLGAFITPVTLLMLLGSGVEAKVAQVSDSVRSAILPVHVLVNILGIVAFALAFGVAIAYVIQEQMLRRRQLGGVFRRLPALDVLDSLGLRLVTIGFPLFTVGMLTGSLWAVRIGAGHVRFSPGQGFAVLAWAFFAIVLLSRAAAGWRGRRAAIGTMLGFLCTMAAMAGYVLRGMALEGS
ncbi:MAG: cytochrome c biogenesis protein CcsA [Myxococcales bacterium]|nr:cytochrome c biogenesis protein CcsA [Myxococcales bacterium]